MSAELALASIQGFNIFGKKIVSARRLTSSLRKSNMLEPYRMSHATNMLTGIFKKSDAKRGKKKPKTKKWRGDRL